MGPASIRDKYKKLLLDYAHRRLLSDAASAALRGNRNAWAVGYPAAYLATQPLDGDDSLVGSKKLMQVAIDCGDHFYRDWVRRNRTTLPNEHFSTTFFVDLYGQLETHISVARRERWRRSILSHCEALAGALAKKLSVKREHHTALEVGCGPNHLYCWAAMLYKGGLVLGRADFRKRAQWAIHRLLAAQDASGYHPEHVGPVLQYHAVTLSALSMYYRLSQDTACLDALRRGAAFWCNVIYPDLSPIEVFDERNRWGMNYALAAHGALMLTPVGRRYIHLALDRMLAGEPPRRNRRMKGHVGSHVGWILRHLLHYTGGDEKPLPIESPKMLHRMGSAGLVRRSGAWVYALSAFCNEPWETNPFILDRVQNLSAWHRKTGLIVGGGNDKYAPEVATFYALEGGFVGYYRPRSGHITVGKAGDYAALDYGPIQAVIDVRAQTDRMLKIDATLDHWVLNLCPAFNLQLQLRAGDEVTFGAGRKVRLTRTVGKPRTFRTGGEIRTALWTLTGPADMTLTWPHMPYNSYARMRHTEIEAAVGIATVPFAAEGGRAEMRLRVR